MDTSTKYEFDQFGPWILEIAEDNTVPPLFMPHFSNEDSPILSLMIPRDMEEQELRPGMNLYDYVVSMYEDNLVILERYNDEVNTYVVPYPDIECIQISEELLVGNMRIFTAKKVLNIRYNTISSEMISRMVNLIREKYTDNYTYDEINQAAFDPEDTMSYFFSGLLSEECVKNSAIRVLVAQSEVSVNSHGTKGFRKRRYAVTDKKLQETLVLSNGKELVIVRHNDYFRDKTLPEYSLNKLFLPIRRITNFELHKDREMSQLIKLILSASNHVFSLFVTYDNPSLMPFIRAITAATGVELKMNLD